MHAFINIAMNADQPFSVGEVVGDNAAMLEGEAVKGLFERSMRSQTGSDLAYYEPDSVVGRLRKGTIRTGDIYNLESWQERVVVGEIQGAKLLPGMASDIDPAKTYTFATTGYAAQRLVGLGALRGVEQRMKLRDATIRHALKFGFA